MKRRIISTLCGWPKSPTRRAKVGELTLPIPSVDERRRTADRIFWGACAFNALLTLFWLLLVTTQGRTQFFGTYRVDAQTLGELVGLVISFYVVSGFVWYGIKAALLRSFVGFTRADRSSF